MFLAGISSYGTQSELQCEIIALKQAAAKLKQENSQLKELCEVAYFQLSQYQEKMEDRHEEVKLLKQQMIELSSKGDYQVVISRLQQQLLSLQVKWLF